MWLWLSMCYSTYSVIPKRLIEYFGSPTAVYNAGESEYRQITRNYSGLCSKDTGRAQKIAEYIKRNNVGIITYNDPSFPKRLKALDNCPIVLYYVGKLYDFDTTPSIGVVGTRAYSEAGQRFTKRVSYDLARSGFTLVSGLAKGIDSFSHRAALYNQSMTTAVLGCGIDVIYPPENRELTLQMYAEGLVITEFPPGTRPYAANFPARNRIISALSDGILVTECTLRSGTIITANYALESGRPVFMCDALCGNALEYLKEKGAVSIRSADDITVGFKNTYPHLKLISELPRQSKLLPRPVTITARLLESFPEHVSAVKVTRQKPSTPPAVDFTGLDEGETEIMKRLQSGAMSIDQLTIEGMTVTDVLRCLTTLELKGLISSPAGGKYVINT